MNSFLNRFPTDRKFWILAILTGLLVETCLLAAVVGFWVYGRGPSNPGQGGGASTPLAMRTGTPPPTPATPSPVSGEAAHATQPEVTSRAPTDTPGSTHWEGSPPPGKIVYVCFDGHFDQICLMNADGSGQVQLTDTDSTNFYPSLSPDGQEIAFSSRRDGNFEIYLMDIHGKNLKQLTKNLGNLYAPAISPKGNRIAFTAETGGKQSIWIMQMDGSNPHPLTAGGGTDIDPVWSPDAELIAFASSRNGTTTLYTVTADGKKVQKVFKEKDIKIGGRSSWSPDGRWLAFYAGPQADHNIYLVDVDGQTLKQLTHGGDNLAPSFSPDGQWLAFTSFRDGNNEVYVMRTDGSQVTRLTYNPRSDWQPRWGP